MTKQTIICFHYGWFSNIAILETEGFDKIHYVSVFVDVPRFKLLCDAFTLLYVFKVKIHVFLFQMNA